MAIIYGPVSCNIDPLMDEQRIITISKSLGDAKNICNAETVTLATIDLAKKMMPRYQDNLDYEEIQDFVISKGDRINIPFQQQCLKKDKKRCKKDRKFHNNKMLDDQIVPEDQSFLPRTFQSAILAAKPEGQEFWKITKETKFEFENTDIAEIFDSYRFRLKNLINVILISKQLSVEDTGFTIPSLEVYPDRMKLIWYSHQKVKIPDSDFVDPLKTPIEPKYLPKLVIAEGPWEYKIPISPPSN